MLMPENKTCRGFLGWGGQQFSGLDEKKHQQAHRPENEVSCTRPYEIRLTVAARLLLSRLIGQEGNSGTA